MFPTFQIAVIFSRVIFQLIHLFILLVQNVYGYTALMNAAYYKHIKIIARLLEYGADRDIQDYNGHSVYARVDGDQMRFMIRHTKSFAQIAEDEEKAREEAKKAALGIYCFQFILRFPL